MNDQTYLLRQNERLFEATLNEFSSKPYALASTNEIIKNAEYNKGSFYYRFKTKEDIYIALIDYVYIQQLALFERQHLRISIINSVSDIITTLFDNLKELYKMDLRYVLLLRNIYRENDELKKYIKQYCISSFLERIVHQTELLFNSFYDSRESKLFLDFLLFSYHNDEIDFDESEYRFYVSSVSEFLTTKTKRKNNTNTSCIDWHTFNKPLNFVLMREQAFSKVLVDEICYLSDKVNNLDFLKEIRKTLKIQKLDLENILRSGIKKNLKDFSHLLKLSGLPFYSTSYHQLTLDQKLVLVITYFVLIGKENIVIDYLLKFINFKDIVFLFEDLLPILSKTSTIILVEEEFYTAKVMIENLYSLSKENGLDKVDLEPPQDRDRNRYEIQYLDANNKIKTIQKSETDIHMEDYYKYRFITLNAIHKIRIQDLV